jgi:hypothetical protein
MVSPSEPVPPVAPPTSSTAPARRPIRRRIMAAPAPSPEQTLAARAREVLQRRGASPPARWLLPGFARDVDAFRRQLVPLHDRRMLSASFERESTRLAALRRLAVNAAAAPLPMSPLEAAYAVRWLELADGGDALPPWVAFVGAEPEAAHEVDTVP